MAEDRSRRIPLGRINGLFGVRGWVKVFSHTSPREGIVEYSPWLVRRGEDWVPMEVEAGHRQGKTVVAKLAGIDDREAAEALLGSEIAIERSQLPPPAEGEYYWIDLLGLPVETVGGVPLGRVDHLIETGAHDVLVVKGERERLIPFVPGHHVQEVDLEGGRIVVDWDPEF
ncbi:MAG: ribosome maturation factor RimM [Gammaproteobacteria bacterium]|nr:MAG: ribosome maturation factor RimM [Gammaproteobacteria bacterium]